jgi:hypothetical protein
MDLIESSIGNPGEDEDIVLSVIADRSVSGDWRLRYATCLVVPRECAEMSWSGWCARESGESEGTVLNGPLPTAVRASAENWLMAREQLDPETARRWLGAIAGLAEGSGDGVLPSIGNIPALEVSLSEATGVIRAMPGADSAAGSLLAGAARPAEGILWRAAHQPEPVELPPSVDIEGASTTWPPRDLCGIHLTPEWVEPRLQTPEGIFAGRIDRQAWLIEQEGTREGDHKRVRIGWEPTRIDPGELVVQTEEFDAAGEMLLSEQIALADLDLSSVRATGRIEVSVPSLGPGLRHGLSLYGPDGRLLDRRAPAPFAESVALAVSIDGGEPVTRTIGAHASPPTLAERQALKAEAQDSLEALRRAGAENRVLRERTAGLARLRALLENARGELLVSDPFFGQLEEDWELVKNLAVPVRVLTRKVESEPAPVPTNVAARIRPKASKLLHERVYVWDGGGFLLGGSPSTIGGPPVTIQPLSAIDADVQHAIFEGLWVSPHFRDVERLST